MSATYPPAEQRFVLATANPDKVIEIRELMEGLDLLARPSNVPDVEETGDTLEENARLKARALVEATGIAAIADDTGLFVDALDGKPGIHSARFAGEHATYADNVDLMLAVMEDVGSEDRSAYFATVALARYPDGRELIAEGRVLGVIATEPRGEGMGYDPIFEPEGSGGLTFGELGMEGKQRISHRARAFRVLRVNMGL